MSSALNSLALQFSQRLRVHPFMTLLSVEFQLIGEWVVADLNVHIFFDVVIAQGLNIVQMK